MYQIWQRFQNIVHFQLFCRWRVYWYQQTARHITFLGTRVSNFVRHQNDKFRWKLLQKHYFIHQQPWSLLRRRRKNSRNFSENGHQTASCWNSNWLKWKQLGKFQKGGNQHMVQPENDTEIGFIRWQSMHLSISTIYLLNVECHLISLIISLIYFFSIIDQLRKNLCGK